MKENVVIYKHTRIRLLSDIDLISLAIEREKDPLGVERLEGIKTYMLRAVREIEHCLAAEN